MADDLVVRDNRETHIVTQGAAVLATMSEATFETRLAQLKLGKERVRRIQREMMILDEDFGTIPGTKKPTLLKPGAETLCQVYSLVAVFYEEVTRGDGITTPHLRVKTKCYLHVGDSQGPIVGEGIGAANSWERRYRYRAAGRACPSCGVEGSIKRSRFEKENDKGWYCLTPETAVLRADFTWASIGNLSLGDSIIGFDEYPNTGQPRLFRPAVVERIWRARKPSMRLVTEHGEVVTTDEHRWLTHSYRANWTATKNLRIGTSLRWLGIYDAPSLTEDFRAGYIAGMTIGDGTFDPAVQWRVALKASDEPAIGRLAAYLSLFGIDGHVGPFSHAASERCPMLRISVSARAGRERLSSICGSDSASAEFARGFVSGFFDAEGSGERSRLSMYQNDRRVLERVQRYLEQFGFKSVIGAPSSRGTSTLRVGGIGKVLRFMATFQPALLRKADVYGRRTKQSASRVVATEALGLTDVVDIQTSTHTFYAGGFATHNCHTAVGGCGAEFKSNDPQIAEQEGGMVDNPDPFDIENTLFKMAAKRAQVDAVLRVTATSGLFTQDLEDMEEHGTATRRDATRTSTPASETKKAEPSADGSMFVKSVAKKDGKSVKTVKNKETGEDEKVSREWTLYTVTFDDGRGGTTFDKALADHAEHAKASGAKVVPVLEKGDKGTTLKGFEAVKKAEPPQPPDEPVNGPEKVLTVRRRDTSMGPRFICQTERRELITDQELVADMLTKVAKDKGRILPVFEVVKKPGGGTVNRLVEFSIEAVETTEVSASAQETAIAQA